MPLSMGDMGVGAKDFFIELVAVHLETMWFVYIRRAMLRGNLADARCHSWGMRRCILLTAGIACLSPT